MLYGDRAYNPLVREWEPKAIEGLVWRGCMHSHLESTPGGAVAYSSKGLFRVDTKKRVWQKLPWEGDSFGGIWCDGHALCYDSKRDCLWFANSKVIRYDMATGKASKVQVTKPKALGKLALWGEQVYLPDSDMILLMRPFKKPDGKLANVLWSPENKKYYWVDIPYIVDGKPLAEKAKRFNWSDALRYDPKFKLILLNNSSAGRVWALKLDSKKLKLEEIKDPLASP